MTRVVVLALTFGAIAAAGCRDSAAPAAPASLVAPDSITVLENDSIAPAVSLADVNGNTIAPARGAWVADDTSIVSVSQTGVVRFLRPGRTRVAVLSNGFSRVITVTASVRYWAMATSGSFPRWCGTTTRGAVYCDSSATGVTHRIGLGLSEFTLGENVQCGLDASGRALCRGQNYNGELGAGLPTGTTLTLDTFVVAAPSQRFRALVADASHTCGLATDSLAWCWGWQVFGPGALGNPDSSDGPKNPAPIAGGRRFKAIATGYDVSCGIEAVGDVYCWGKNSRGLLGQDPGLLNHSITPVKIAGVSNALLVTVSYRVACALVSGGGVLCWGQDNHPALGRTCTSSCWQPGIVPIPKAVDVAASYLIGEAVCAVVINLKVMCWGQGSIGMLGDGTTMTRSTPAPITAPGSFVTLSRGEGGFCALRDDDVAFCWGQIVSPHLGPERLPFQP